MTDYILPVPYSKTPYWERKQIREQYARIQGGKCYWCHQDLAGKPRSDVLALHVNLNIFPPNFLKHPVHLQHNHDTDMTEGAVHARCNAVMWQYHGR
jgi:hypothetical protein